MLNHNPLAPKRQRCACGAEVVQVHLAGGRPLLVDHPEVTLPEPDSVAEVDPGIYVAVNSEGDARPLRWPSADLRNGEALYRPHELSCVEAVSHV